ncbi:MAG: rhomboid family intramembrane serine protease [Sphingomonas sp.]
MHGIWLAAAWTAINLLVSFALPIAWGAHVGGFVAGLLLARPLLRWRWRGA